MNGHRAHGHRVHHRPFNSRAVRASSSSRRNRACSARARNRAWPIRAFSSSAWHRIGEVKAPVVMDHTIDAATSDDLLAVKVADDGTVVSADRES